MGPASDLVSAIRWGAWSETLDGHALLIAMAILLVGALIVFYWCEARGNPILTALGVDPYLGNMEGKDLRFGQAGIALLAQATTGTGTGASNGLLESMTPLLGMAALFNLLLGCISPGGVGTGLYSLLPLVFITAFIGALMIGQTRGRLVDAEDCARQPRRRWSARSQRDRLRLCL
jgi:K+-transporting ATPase ATPase A chain